MSALTKVFIVLVSVMSIALSCLFVAAAAQFENWKALASVYQVQRDAAITHEQNAIAAALASATLKDEAIAAQKAENAQLLAKLEEANNRNVKLESELAIVKNERLAFEAGRTKLQEILDVQTSQLRTAEKQNQLLMNQNLDLQSRASRQNARILELTTDKTILVEQARNLQEKLYAAENLGAYRSTSAQPARTVSESIPGAVSVKPRVAGVIRGQITTTDGAYASIDVGESSGVVQGLTFMVFRGQTYLGELQVDLVEPRSASGKLMAMAPGVEIRRGDSVAFGLENN